MCSLEGVQLQSPSKAGVVQCRSSQGAFQSAQICPRQWCQLCYHSKSHSQTANESKLGNIEI
jgi:hypothetical protein